MLILGNREMKNNTVAVRLRTEEDLGTMSLETFINMAKRVIEEKALALT